MKRLWIAVAILVALAGLVAVHVFALEGITGQMTDALLQARQELIDQNWEPAQELIQEAYDDWESNAFYLHATLRHTDIDAVRSCFQEAMAYLSAREDAPECAALCARLVNLLELILEGELPSLKNLL